MNKKNILYLLLAIFPFIKSEILVNKFDEDDVLNLNSEIDNASKDEANLIFDDFYPRDNFETLKKKKKDKKKHKKKK